MEHNFSKDELAKLSVVEIPDGVIGNIHTFKNFDPTRILHFELKEDSLLLYMKEEMRLEAVEEFRSTIEAFRYEVERGVRPEVEAYLSVDYNDDFSKVVFTVNYQLYMRDITSEMIEISLVEDALKYQIYDKRPILVEINYIDGETNELFVRRFYPDRR